ncbi:MAG: PHP domain-containing protein, partial [Mycobacterium sp.]|nr:PHP domain-containing protein [Mycobacterium sp.]
MGWSNGPPRWAELERVLSGRPDDFPAAKKTVDIEPEPVRSQPPEQPVVPYAELHAHSAYSFLDGACGPETLVEEARNLGLTALALTDHDGLYGVVQFAQAAVEVGLPTVFGAELSLVRPGETRMGVPDPAGEHLLVLARGQEGYRRLSREISAAHLAGGEKG